MYLFIYLFQTHKMSFCLYYTLKNTDDMIDIINTFCRYISHLDLTNFPHLFDGMHAPQCFYNIKRITSIMALSEYWKKNLVLHAGLFCQN